MTKAEFIDGVYNALDGKFTKKDTTEAIQVVFDAIAKAVQEDGRISYPNFGTFTLNERAARKGRNPRTKEIIDIPASKTIKFKPAPAFKDSL